VSNPKRPNTIESCASVVRSKNAGPYQITVDVFFKDPATYFAFKDAGILTPRYVAGLYKMDVSDVLGIYFWDRTHAVKVTLRRAVTAGSPFDNDCYGAQQHAPLLDVPVPVVGAPRLVRDARQEVPA
jgi:Domain of unknown function (DUF4387)